MQVSKRFLALLDQQLAQFTDRPDLRALVVYAALPGDNGRPTLMAIGHWPAALALRANGSDGADDPADAESDTRRWLALRDGSLLLGALRVDADQLPWPPALEARLEATARCLTEALRLDMDQQQLGRELARREDQLRLLVHQLRNPLAALRTFGQLLRRRLDGDEANLSLVDNLLHEQGQINRYLDAIEAIDQGGAAPSLSASGGTTPLLLPPGLQGDTPQPLAEILQPLLERAAATAKLQGRPWYGPGPSLPPWQGDGSAVAEILANLLENAFRYSRSGGPIGLLCQPCPAAAGAITLAVWDGGPEIPAEERTRIFERGQRGSTGAGRPGSGLGLALGRELAAQLGGSLRLQTPPAALDPHNPDLPGSGNAFCLQLP
ncbi:two-component sensor histidine kinase [Cyanobium sp.]|nr:two-component sensor histidine kinase [Cyanobium sp.]